MNGSARNLFCLVLLALHGCGQATNGVAVSGEVTSDGEPVEAATIHFKPMPGNGGPRGRGQVTGGRYHIPASEGLHPGRYIVEVEFNNPPQKKVMLDKGSRELRKSKQAQSFQREHNIQSPSAQIDLQL
jgi:hypothetical protein